MPFGLEYGWCAAQDEPSAVAERKRETESMWWPWVLQFIVGRCCSHISCEFCACVRICCYIRVEHVYCYKFLWRCHISVQGNIIKSIVVVAVGLLRRDLLLHLHWYPSLQPDKRKISCLHVGALTSCKLDNMVWYLAIFNNNGLFFNDSIGLHQNKCIPIILVRNLDNICFGVKLYIERHECAAVVSFECWHFNYCIHTVLHSAVKLNEHKSTSECFESTFPRSKINTIWMCCFEQIILYFHLSCNIVQTVVYL